MLQLFSADISPFAARVRIAIYYEHLPFEDLGMPRAGLKSAEFLAITPMGKIPVPLLSDGRAIAESEIILDYLDDAHPERPLRPASPVDRAQMRTVIRDSADNAVIPASRSRYPRRSHGHGGDSAHARWTCVARVYQEITTAMQAHQH
jgi:glutathione S-transferase